jgi:hypothetical protein
MISVDHAYTLYLNGQELSKGADWRKVQKLDVQNFMVPGKNLIAIEGVNEGNIANPAGILLALKIIDNKGEEILIQSGRDWKSIATQPNGDWTTLSYNDDDWSQVRDYGANHWDKLLDYKFGNLGKSFVRASLVRQHPFLKVLGRPSRENVTTSREDQTTLLQALELTNGDYLNNVLNDGAETWIKRHNSNANEIIEALYQKSFGRSPADEEKEVMLTALGKKLTVEAVHDLFWSVILLPEFQFIY